MDRYRDDRRREDRTRSRERDGRRGSPPRARRSRSPDSPRREERRRDRRERSRTRSRSASRSSDDRRDSKKRKRRETSEERAQRKADKRKLKEELRRQKETQFAAQVAIQLGYSNKDNPFNDANLSQKFVWAKKVESEQKAGLNEAQRLAMEKRRRDEAMAELEKLNRKRAEREEEIRLREEEAERLRREQERAKLGDWETKEVEFHLEQAKRRAQIRIKEGRAKPIDVLAMNLSLATDGAIADEFDAMGLEMEMDEPYAIFQQGLQLEDVEELDRDIRMYLELEKDETNIEFWKAMLVVCEDELSKHRSSMARGRKPGVSAAVLADIDRLLRDKNFEQLTVLQRQVEDKLASGGPVDVEYWEALMKSLLVWKAKTRLKDMHRVMLRKRLERLRERQREEAARGVEELRQPIKLQLQSAGRKQAEALPENGEEDDAGPDAEDEAEELPDAYDPSMSPRPLEELSKEDQDLEIVNEDEDALVLEEKRKLVLSQQLVAKPRPKAAVAAPAFESNDDRLWREEAAKAMDEDEEVFASEVAPETKSYLWQDKYRPRKPRYFNRVHTGYEWNKYNQTHYDTDNPPPKVVQGYKFNIFYPDLIDKTKAPSFQIIKDKSNPDIAVIKFTAGPPYEDIAFNIVNKEWEHSHKKGFRCVFDRGVLQLHFRFKRHFYRK
ncbi:mid region of cactin-domain-containing protein [Hyaloraphidium curvatum]|nr:mid region of cactin-domain-containing protein [Hyaloraphidium curvatum]